jgi:RIO-like serine/threonine protein kinase
MEIRETLKSDVFGTITRVGNVVVRDTGPARPWARALARYLMLREHRALKRLTCSTSLDGVPRVISYGGSTLVRGWIEGQPMHVARPRDPDYFREALRLVRRLHAADVLHNDLAKETNWLVTAGGKPALVDFQLASTLNRRGALARSLGHDDLRHLLKHKRTYVPERLTAREKRILARPSLVSRLWMASGKQVYLLVTRKLLRWRDREGAGDRGSGQPPM